MQILRFKWPMRNAVRLCAIRTLFDKCVNFINSILSLQTLAELFYANFAEIILFNCAPSLCVCVRAITSIHVSRFVLEKQRIGRALIAA